MNSENKKWKELCRRYRKPETNKDIFVDIDGRLIVQGLIYHEGVIRALTIQPESITEKEGSIKWWGRAIG